MLLAKFLLQTLGRFRTRNQSVEAAALVVVNLLEKMVFLMLINARRPPWIDRNFGF